MTQTALIEKDGQTYLRVGDRAIPVELDDNGVPRPVRPQIERTEPEGGRVDVIVKVPCLTIVPSAKNPGE